jgi:hypothetical protein
MLPATDQCRQYSEESDHGRDPQSRHPTKLLQLASTEFIPKQMKFLSKAVHPLLDDTKPLLHAPFEFLGPLLTVCEPRLQTPLELTEPLIQLPFELKVGTREPGLQQRLEPGEVGVVDGAEVGPVGEIHLVEPFHQFVGDLFTEPVVKGLGVGATPRVAHTPVR